MKLRFGDRQFSIELDDYTESMLRGAIEQAAPGLVAEMERTTAAVVESARAGWPVKTGRSRDGLTAIVRLEDEKIVGVVYSSELYGYMIKRKDGKSPWQELVRKPSLGVAMELAGRLGPIMAGGMVRR